MNIYIKIYIKLKKKNKYKNEDKVGVYEKYLNKDLIWKENIYIKKNDKKNKYFN